MNCKLSTSPAWLDPAFAVEGEVMSEGVSSLRQTSRLHKIKVAALPPERERERPKRPPSPSVFLAAHFDAAEAFLPFLA